MMTQVGWDVWDGVTSLSPDLDSKKGFLRYLEGGSFKRVVSFRRFYLCVLSKLTMIRWPLWILRIEEGPDPDIYV